MIVSLWGVVLWVEFAKGGLQQLPVRVRIWPRVFEGSHGRMGYLVDDKNV